MRSRGTRIDDLTVEPIGESRPGYYRMIRFGNFSQGNGSKEMIVNRKELENFARQATAILLKENDKNYKKKVDEKNGKTKKSI